MKAWWKEGIIYQIYPQSFYDKNGDGIGDLRGIMEKLDYVQDLGVDILWLNPIYQSPMDDNGYDVSNYREINPIYGTMDDFDALLGEIHSRGMRLLMDLVPNHTSDEHRWFEESRKSRDSPYRDYYFWRPGKNGGPPNNWPSFFGGPAWEYDSRTGEYYLHLFTKKQPDLNWENPKVRREIQEVVRWWLDKGIDGFRLDVIPMISKYTGFPDADLSDFNTLVEKWYCNGPRVHEYIRELHDEVLRHYDIMTVGEGPGITKDRVNLYTGKDRGELNMIYPLELMFVTWGPGGKFDDRGLRMGDFKAFYREWDEVIGDEGWVSIFLDNHDFARMVSRFGNDTAYRESSAKLLCMLLLTMRGTPTIYFGSEIGMTNVAFPTIDDYRDVESLNFYYEAIRDALSPEDALHKIHVSGRDNVRTPMQWSDAPHGGFSSREPWIKVNPNYPDINVARESMDPTGILQFYKDMIAFRKAHPVFVYGQFEDRDPDHACVMCYTRQDETHHFLVALNFSDDHTPYALSAVSDGQPVISNYPGPVSSGLRPWEGRIYALHLD